MGFVNVFKLENAKNINQHRLERAEDVLKYKIVNHIQSGKPTYLFFYLIGCGPCNAAKEQWTKIKDNYEFTKGDNDNVLVAAINQKYFGEMNTHKKILGEEQHSFPHLISIDKNGTVEKYEGGRLVNEFVSWITSSELKKNNQMGVMTKHTPFLTKRHQYSKKKGMSGKTRKNYKNARERGRGRGRETKRRQVIFA